MRPNWFVAFPVQLGPAYAALVAEPPSSVRVFQPADLHMTVAFLGGVDEETARAGWQAACDGAPGPFRVRFGSVEPFGNPRRPSAVGLTVAQGRDALVSYLAEQAPTILEAAGQPPEKREPKPHVTIARPGKKASKDERREAVDWARGLTPPPDPVTLDRLALYTWATDRKKQQFRIIEEQSLT